MESFKDSAESLADSTVYILICVDSVDFVFSKCLCSMDCFGRFAPSQRRQEGDFAFLRGILHNTVIARFCVFLRGNRFYRHCEAF